MINTAVRPPLFTPYKDAAWQKAGELMAERNIPEEDHTLLHENLATGLSHSSERFTLKVERDLKNPYTDDQILNRCDELQTSLRDTLASLPAYPSKLYITGSFSHGRLGVNSDLDSYGVIPAKDVPATYKVFAEADENPFIAKMFPFNEERPGYNEAMLMVSGASVEINPRDLEKPGFLRETYQEVVARREPPRQETHPVYEWACSKLWSEGLTPSEKVDQFEGKSMFSKVMGWGLSLTGTLAMTPFVGPVIRGCANWMVKQDHHRLEA